MSQQHLMVVGASRAGLRAVEAARRDGHAGPITLIGAEQHLPYDRPPLSKEFLQSADEPEPPHYREDAEYQDELDVELVLGCPASALDTTAQQVEIGDRRIGYDALVIATGARPVPLPGAPDLAGVHLLRTLDDAVAIRTAMKSEPRVVVVGGGFIGAEVASSARKRGLEVTVVEALPTPLIRAVGEEMGAACAALHEANGTVLRCGVSVEELEGDKQVERVRLSDGTTLAAELVVVGIGVRPNIEWLDGSGLELDNGVICDETLAAGPPGVYAAGDVARWRNPLFGDRMRLEHWTSAGEQGAAAARNALDPTDAKSYSTVPYFWSDQYDSKIQLVGVPEADEVRVVSGDPKDLKFVALYRRGDRLVGALAVDRPAEVMKYRRKINNHVSWNEALEFAEQRNAKAAEKSEPAARRG